MSNALDQTLSDFPLRPIKVEGFRTDGAYAHRIEPGFGGEKAGKHSFRRLLVRSLKIGKVSTDPLTPSQEFHRLRPRGGTRVEVGESLTPEPVRGCGRCCGCAASDDAERECKNEPGHSNLPVGNPHLKSRLIRLESKPKPTLADIQLERIAIHNRAIAFLLSAAIYFALGFYAATRI